MGQELLVMLIRLYQRTLSPDHGWLRAWRTEPFCSHQPTCSDYGIEALTKHGVQRGVALTVQRLSECGRSRARLDPVP